MGKKEQKRKSVKPEKTKAEKLRRPNFAKEFLKWRKERPSKLIKDIKELGYLKNDTNRDVREKESPERNSDVSKDKDSST
jgi:hypothetical protein